MKVLVTGSRNWEGAWAEDRISRVLSRFLDLSHALSSPLRIMHGACPEGADAAAQRWADRRGVPSDQFPADWLKYGKGAGPMRNRYMVNQGADVCIAFIRDNSRGATGTVDLARQAGIPTYVIPWFTETGNDDLH